jgi:hypothetical protein
MSRSFLSRVPTWAYGALLFLLGMGFAVAAKNLGLVSSPIGAGLVVVFVSLIVSPAAVLYWRRLDEAAREAHKFAWYWGGSAGIVLVLAAYLALTAPAGAQIPVDVLGATEPRELFALGMMATLAAQIVGYLVAWVGWWAVRR